MIQKLKIIGIILVCSAVFFGIGFYKGMMWAFEAYTSERCWVNESERATNCNIYND